MKKLADHAATYYPELDGKLVSAGLLVAWLFMNHEHLDDEGVAVVSSIHMEAFIRQLVAISEI